MRAAIFTSLAASIAFAYFGVQVSKGRENDPGFIPVPIAVSLMILGCLAAGMLVSHGFTLYFGSITIVPERRRDHRLLSRSARREWTVAAISTAAAV